MIILNFEKSVFWSDSTRDVSPIKKLIIVDFLSRADKHFLIDVYSESELFQKTLFATFLRRLI